MCFILLFSAKKKDTMGENIYTPAMAQRLVVGGLPLSRNEMIAVYYHSGYTIQEIIGFFASRLNTALSARQIHRVLREMNLTRRNNQPRLEDIVTAILHELSGSGGDIGYRGMRRRLLVDHDLNVSCELVRLALTVLDAEGVIRRRQRRLQRRRYINEGPNFCVHLDGWDKLKPFGISIHGCVDGFSRRILWLRACNSNKNPEYISRFYIDYIKEINGVPVVVYADRGTENCIVRDLQYALRWNHQDPLQGLSSFRYGSSYRNTSIERFWRCLREMCGNFWINYFKDMDYLGVFDTSDVVHLECARYCFLPIINRELYRVIQHWNEHTIRRNRNADCPSGKPDVMYFQPEIYQTRDYKMPIPGNLNGIEQEYCAYPPANGVSMEFEVIGTQIRIENGLNYPPNTVEEATELFIRITNYVDRL